MSVSISVEQNKPDNLRMLAAQRYLYTRAKYLRRWRVGLSVGLALLSPIIMYFWPESRTVLAGIGSIWLVISHLVLEEMETKKTKQAATIQEQFDTSLFSLPWNMTLVGNKMTPELIYAAARAYSEDRLSLKDWYPDTSRIMYPLDVLLSQRSNLVWDWRLRRAYGGLITVATTCLVFSTILFACITKQSALNYFLGLFLPSISAVLQGIEVAKGHFKVSKEKEDREKEISALWESALKREASVSLNDCRRIQDFIFILRSKGPLVSDRWYKWLRSRYEIDMQSVIKEMRLKAEAVSLQKIK